MDTQATDSPLVSVIIRTKDRRALLEYALDSCRRQTWRPLEIVLVNDGGAGVDDLLEHCADAGLQTRLVTHEVSRGRSAAANAGLDAANGEWLIFLDDDDWFEPEHIAGLVAALTSADANGRLAAYAGVRYCAAPDAEPLHVFNRAFDPVALRLENFLPIHAVLFSRQLLTRGCQIDETLEVFEDWDFWLQCACQTDFIHVDRIGAGYRAGGDSNAGWGQDAARVAAARQLLLGKWRGRWTAADLDETLRWGQDHLRAVEADREKLIDAHRELITMRDALERHRVDQAEAFDRLLAEYRRLEREHRVQGAQHRNEIQAVQGELAARQAAFDELHCAYIETRRSTSWRVTAPLRIVSRTAARGRRGWSALREARRRAGGGRALARKVFARLRQDGVRGVLYRARLHLSRTTLPMVPATPGVSRGSFCPSPAQLHEPCELRCGVMAHVFYLDLFPELCRYLANIPVPYQLLVSVVSEQAREQLLAQRHLLTGQVELTVKVVANRGRDIAPFFVAFRDEIRQLDVIGHLHTKKSSHSAGRFGEDWRTYLFSSLLGCERTVRAVLAQFRHDPQVGFIYPITFPDMAYWAHTWLANRAQGGELLARLGWPAIDFDQYFCYPVGSMFWARTRALEPLFALDLCLEDFPPERGQTDGTLAHAIERCLPFAAAVAGFGSRLLERTPERTCFHAYTPFIVDRYDSGRLPQRLAALADGPHAVLSFDLFDTLLHRPFARPEALLWMLEEWVERDFGLTGFTRKRGDAEAALRARLGPLEDVAIEQIYRELARREGLEQTQADALMALEITTEQRLLRPNPPVAEVLRALRAGGRRLVALSDMYLGADHLRPLLQRHELDLFDRLYISADTGRRKDRGDAWEALLAAEGIGQDDLQHVGDNERSDIQLPGDRGFPTPLHVMRPAALLGLLPGGQALIATLRARPGWRNELILGLIANRIAEALHRGTVSAHQPLADPRLLGYVALGPTVFAFMMWLVRDLRARDTTSVRFLSREGWLLAGLYDSVRERLRRDDIALPPGQYFYCSRAFCGLAALRDEQDLALMLNADYDGTLRQFLGARLGLRALEPYRAVLGDTLLDERLCLPGDRERLRGILHRVLPQLLATAAAQRAEMVRYWRDSAPGGDARPALVDLGYSGTIQLALMKILERPLDGLYFVTNAYARRISDAGGECAACYGNLLSLETMNEQPVHRYALLLEAVLTSPEGQLAGFEQVEQGMLPVFRPGGHAQREFATIQSIQDGIQDFSRDVLEVLGTEALADHWDLSGIADLLGLVAERELPIGSLDTKLMVEDQYSGGEEWSVLTLYDHLRTQRESVQG